jgi:hypothetical protein
VQGRSIDKERDNGLALVIAMNYKNYLPYKNVFDAGEVFYQYHVYALDFNSTFTNIFYTNYSYVDDGLNVKNFPNRRVVHKNKGIQLHTTQTGQLGKWGGLSVALATVTSSLTLLLTAALLVKMAAIYVLPLNAYYYNEIYDSSPDFSDLEECEYVKKPSMEPKPLSELQQWVRRCLHRAHLALFVRVSLPPLLPFPPIVYRKAQCITSPPPSLPSHSVSKSTSPSQVTRSSW